MGRNSDVPCWYVVRTGARQEARATVNLNAWGVETFLPRMRVRRLNRYTGTSTYELKPLFPGYLFARFSAGRLLHQVGYTRGVRCVVSFGGMPAKVDDSIIEFIYSQLDEDGFVKMWDEIRVGDKVRIKCGPLADFVGVFDRRVNETNRVAILLTAVSYQGRIVIERDFLERVSRVER